MNETYRERRQKTKAKYPKAYEPWSKGDDDFLRVSYAKGLSKQALSDALQRQSGAIQSRLKKLDLLKVDPTGNPEPGGNLAPFLPVFVKYTLSGEYKSDRVARQERQALYANVLSPQAVDQMTELEFGQVISSLWANQMWGSNKGYQVDRLIQENSLPALKNHFKDLLWGAEELAIRYDAFRREIKGFGTAMLAEILAFIHPDQCGVWNDRARFALNQLGYYKTIPFIQKRQLSGTEYQQFNSLVGSLVEELKPHGFIDLDYLGINYFFYEIWRTAKKEIPAVGNEPRGEAPIVEAFNHDEVIDQLVSIGQALGFQTEKEKLVAKGAKVDVIWQASIANLGVVIYVFEVQSRGSIDSLCMNLQRAQANQSVQRLIIVANAKEIEKIQDEIALLPEDFRRAVSFWEVTETIRAAELVDELFGIINKLELVKSEFGT